MVASHTALVVHTAPVVLVAYRTEPVVRKVRADRRGAAVQALVAYRTEPVDHTAPVQVGFRKVLVGRRVRGSAQVAPRAEVRLASCREPLLDRVPVPVSLARAAPIRPVQVARVALPARVAAHRPKMQA